MKVIKDMLIEQFTKMFYNHSFFIGGIGGVISLTIPQWVISKEITIYHGILLGILIVVFVFEWLVGGRLAKMAKKRNSEYAIDALIRDFMIFAICIIAYGFDYLIGTGSVIFTLFTCAFIYHNFYSLMANVYVLGWGNHFPIWLLKWLDNEIKAKANKYFPDSEIETEFDKTIKDNDTRQ
ncbi:MAG: phage holin family protein [Streptococcaceae bacterium]|jgi:toxin secretion/phage lysis holin|nr:phage holin family protein [Streptococcaceae bacterium]